MLPLDVLQIIFDQLRYQEDFGTLYHSALASRDLACLALPNLYRIHDVSPSAEEIRDTAKWATLWKSLILSTFPRRDASEFLKSLNYISHIRVLSLRDLQDLFEDQSFRLQHSHGFFTGDLAQFEVKPYSSPAARPHSYNRSIQTMVNMIGEHLTLYYAKLAEQTAHTAMLEELDCRDVSSESLHRWIPRFQMLQNLRLWTGDALAGAGSLLSAHCPKFSTLKFYTWTQPSTDEELSAFLRELRPQTLQSLEIFGGSISGPLSVAALGQHCESLVELKLGTISDDLFLSLPLLTPCPNITTLHLETRIKESILEEGVQNEISDWLTSCTRLADIRIKTDAPRLIPELLTPLLLNPDVHLTKLEIRRYDGSQAAPFHAALAEQAPSLRTLILQADGEATDLDILVQSLTRLHELRDLNLFGVGDYFSNAHIRAVANSAPHLEELVIPGWCIDDSVWGSLASLRALRRLDIYAYSYFTPGGVLGFIDSLDEKGNHGLNLTISMAAHDQAMDDEAQARCAEALIRKVEGRFDYSLSRDPNAPDSDSEDD